MRPVLIVLLTAALGFGIWTLVGEDDGAGRPSSPEDADEVELESPEQKAQRDREIRRYGRKTGTLTIRAKTADGGAPAGIEVGYERRDGTMHWLYADDNRARTITDAPLGTVKVFARATGYATAEQKCEVIADVPSSALLLLLPAKPEAGEPEGPPR